MHFSVVVAEFCRFQPGLTWIHRSWMNQGEHLISVASAVDTTMDFGHHSSLLESKVYPKLELCPRIFNAM